MTEKINLKGGVLIIGSLLWQDHLKNEKEDNLRKLWREKHLSLDNKIMVKVPIRYGRLSNSDIYTMTFSNSCRTTKQGTGFFVPFKQTLLTTFTDLMSEVKETSIAEGMNGKLLSKEKGTEKIWCCMGLLTNPQTVSKETKKSLITQWSEKISEQGTLDISQFKIGREKPCIDKKGNLSLNWLSPVDKKDTEKLNSYDLIIATATKPTKYPSIEELSEKVKADTTRYYFIQNYKFGITTFQDIKVLNKV
ncbi:MULTISPECIES: hypothetical protein [unclassified Arcicella]|uniref:hypothetical protein n=1 Tax=unclassified Arcicella TaxID=2644986 RepID=UPI002857063E|nr:MULTISPECIES: hypothetical protein [unclassified Arcicella]MDR6560056.1 hypothetical protein [Arcicella sp. BE51]MDR6810337.1 hypothetical protein [Arcicella sp. BE140]MDR6821687.1 hypothetical protein [Arcicella sp. BE139]